MTRGARGRLFVEPPARVRRPAAWELAAPAPPAPEGRPFAPTPITPFAEAIADLALAAATAQPLPPSPVPTRRPLGPTPAVEWTPTTRPAHLSVMAVAMQVDLVLKRGVTPGDASADERWGTLRVTIVVGRNGLRIVSLRPGLTSSDAPVGAPPPGLEGLPELARTIIADLRRGNVAPYELTEADRRVLANDAVWAQIYEDGPPLRNAPRVAAMLEGMPDTPLAYGLDDVGVLVRDEEGRLYSLLLELDPQGATFALSTDPLVHVRRLWPR